MFLCWGEVGWWAREKTWTSLHLHKLLMGEMKIHPELRCVLLYHVSLWKRFTPPSLPYIFNFPRGPWGKQGHYCPEKTHTISKVQFNASLHGLHPRCTEHRLITVEAYPRPLFLKKQEGPTHDIKSAITSYKVKNMSLFLTFSVSWGLQVRLGISRRADHTIRGPHLLLSPCEADLLRQSGNRVEGSVAWHNIATPRSCTPASWLGLDSSNLPWCFMEATSARRHFEQNTWHMVVWSSVHGWLGPPMLLCWEAWHNLSKEHFW